MQRPASGAILAAVIFSTALAAFAVGAWSAQRCDLLYRRDRDRHDRDRGLLPNGGGLRFAAAPAAPVPADATTAGGLQGAAVSGSAATAQPSSLSSSAAAAKGGEGLQEPTQFVPAFPENRPAGVSREQELATLREEVMFLYGTSHPTVAVEAGYVGTLPAGGGGKSEGLNSDGVGAVAAPSGGAAATMTRLLATRLQVQ